MNVSQAAIDQGMAAGRKALQNYSSFDSSLVPDSALRIFVQDVLVAGFGTIPANTITGPGAHPHPTVNPPVQAAPPQELLAPAHDNDGEQSSQQNHEDGDEDGDHADNEEED